jgi:hypothetical protein
MYVDYSDSFPLHVCKGITVVSQHLWMEDKINYNTQLL